MISGTSVQATTAAIQKLIDDAAAGHHGGVALIPPGTHVTATLFLKSGVTLRIPRGATLQASTDLAHYPLLEAGHNKDRQPYNYLVAVNCDGITIEGDGAIDGRGEEFWNPPLGDKTQGARGLFWREKKQRVTPLLEIRHCKNVTLRDFTIRNSPGWTVHPYCCDNVRITGVKVHSNLFGPNTDGFDINGCRDVWVSDCELRCGDDAIIIKSTSDARSSERIVVTNCIIESNCATIGLGAESTFDIRDVTVSNCVCRAALRMIQFEMWEAGTIENVTISNITGRTMSGVPLERPIYMDIQHHERTDGALGKLRNVVISNFVAQTRGRIVLTAADGAMIENVTLRDIQLTYPEIENPTFTVNHMKSTQMSNDSPLSRDVRSALVADNVRNLRIYNLQLFWPAPDASHEELQDRPYPGIHGTLPMHALWFRNVTGLVDAPGLRASLPDVEPIVQSGSAVMMASI